MFLSGLSFGKTELNISEITDGIAISADPNLKAIRDFDTSALEGTEFNSLSKDLKDIIRDKYEDAKAAQEEMFSEYVDTAKLNIEALKKQRSRKGQIVILLSTSMPENELNQALNATYPDNTALYFRGIGKGESFVSFHRRLAKYVKNKEQAPAVYVDPSLFDKNGITSVPVIGKVGDDGKSLTHIAHGSINAIWFKREIESNPDKTQLAQLGNVYEISEPHIMDTIKSRIKNFDWESRKKYSMSRFWQRVPKVGGIRVAREHRAFTVDPTVTVLEDVIDRQGNILAKKGQSFNPLKTLPFDRRIFVLDPTDPSQLEVVKQYKEDNTGRYIDVYMLTNFDSKDGFKTINKMQKELGLRVYVFDELFKQRLAIEAIPSVVTPVDGLLEIRELAVRN